MKSFTARYTQRCGECQQYIIAGKDKVVRLHHNTQNWIHETCMQKLMDQTLREDLRQDEFHESIVPTVIEEYHQAMLEEI